MKPMLAVPALAGTAAAVVAFGVVMLAGGSGDDAPPRAAAPAPASSSAPASTADLGQAQFIRMGCGGCHTFAAARSRGLVGPDLDYALASYDMQRLVATIRRPPTSGDFAQMPTDFGERMTVKELDALATYLLEKRRR
jgi:mono/diheme cytochrome c family protein